VIMPEQLVRAVNEMHFHALPVYMALSGLPVA